MQFADRSVAGERVYCCDETDGPVAYQCSGGPFPFAPVAAQIPKAGDSVYSRGFPSGVLTYGVGRLLGSNNGFSVRRPAELIPVNVADFPCAPGWSGGPLFNDAGEVVGLAMHTDHDCSYWCTWAALQSAHDACTVEL